MTNPLTVAAGGAAADMRWLGIAAGKVANSDDGPPGPAPGDGSGAAAGPGGGDGPDGTAGPETGDPAFYPSDSLASQLVQADQAGQGVESNAALMRHAVTAFEALLGDGPDSADPSDNAGA